MLDKDSQNKIYEELRGYFPPEYDLTPDELEAEIAMENKKREIALGMMRTKLGHTAEFPKLSQTATNIDIKGSMRSLPERERKLPSPAPDEEIIDEDVILPEEEIIEESIPETASEELLEEAAAEEIPESNEEALDEIEDLPLKELFKEMENPSIPEDDEDYNEGARKTVSWVFDFLEVFTICITAIIVIFAFFARLTEVRGQSMEDTLLDGERLIVSDFMYEPEIGDIVVIQDTTQPMGSVLRDPLVKRIIAVGGQSVDISAEGIVTVTDADGSVTVLEENYIKNEPYMDLPFHCNVEEGYVFVLGDNRNHSSDSRSSLGTVDERCIFGKVLARVLPISEFEIFENPYEK